MKKLVRSIVLPAMLMVAACGDAGTYYEVEPSRAASRITNATLPLHILGSGVDRTYAYEDNDGNVITQLFASNGTELARFTSTIVAEGEGSRVSTEVTFPENAQIDSFEAIYAANLMQELADEHVAAAIEGRAFDMLFATNPAAVGALPPEAREQVNQANEAAQAMNEMAANGPGSGDWGGGSGSDWGDSADDWGY